MRFKKLIAAISAAAMLLPALPFIPGTAPVAEAATKNADVAITGAAVMRWRSTDTPVTGTGFALKNPEDTIQIFANRVADDNVAQVGDGSQCGAYYQYEIPEYAGENAVVTLTLENAFTSTDKLRVISVGTSNAHMVGSNTYTAENVFNDVSAAYNAADKTVIDIAYPVSGKYTVDITALSKQGTNAIFVYTVDNTNDKTSRHDVKNASISLTYDTLPTVVWRASDSSWSLSSGDRINGYANVSNSELTTTMVADNETSNYSGAVKAAFDSSTYHGAAPAVDVANCNIMGMVVTAGDSGNPMFVRGKTYTLHYTLSGNWSEAMANSSGAYLNAELWSGNSRIEGGPNDSDFMVQNRVKENNKLSQEKTYVFTPSVENCYAKFNFMFRRVHAGDYMVVSNIYITTDSEAMPAADKVWSKQWSYDFNDYVDKYEYPASERAKMKLSDTYPKQAPSIVWYKGKITSEAGQSGKPNDNCLAIESTSNADEAARVLYRFENLGVIDDKNEYTAETENEQFSSTTVRRFVDDSIDCLVASMDIKFSNTVEKHYVGSYRIIGTPYNGILFENDGTIKYHISGSTYKDTGKTYQADKWYNVRIRYDFKDGTITYYLDGVKLASHDMPQKDSDARYHFEEISIKGNMNASDPGTTYLDNLALYKEEAADESHLTAQIVSPEKTTYLVGDEVEFWGKVNDGKTGKAPTTVIYLDGTEIQTVDSNTYKINKSDIESGHHTIKAVSTTSDNRSITKELSFDVANYAMPSTYADGMVLQRNKEITIAGFGVNGKEISVTLNGTTKTATVSNGKFKVIFPAQSATKSTTLSVSSEGMTTSYNVAIGEVILCNGQSNMAYTLGRFTNLHGLWNEQYNSDNIRIFRQDELLLKGEKSDIASGKWVKATKMDALYNSAFAFGTARYLQKLTNDGVVIGLVKASIGGTSINTWVPRGSFDNDPDLLSVKVADNNRTAYDAMVAPLTDYTIGSVMWYQGEADTFPYYNYEKMLTTYIDSIREAWGDPSLPFAIVELPICNYVKQYGAIRTPLAVRDGQWNVSQRLDNVVTVVGVDTGDFTDIHPNDKTILCERMANVLYHFMNPSDSSIQYLSPSVSGYSYDETANKMTFTFKNVYSGLKTKDGETAVNGFTVAGDDNNFVDTTAELSGDTVIVDTSKVTGTPKVRYAWDQAPALDGKSTTLNLQNSAGFAAPPFRTDTDKLGRENDGTTVKNFVPMIRDITSETKSDGSTDIIVNARDYDGQIVSVDVFVDGQKVGTTSTKADGSETDYVFNYKDADAGTHSVYAVATDEDNGASNANNISPKTYSLTFAAAVYKDSDYFKFEINSKDDIYIKNVILNITDKTTNKTGTATKTYGDDESLYISAESAAEFYIQIKDVPERYDITSITLN